MVTYYVDKDEIYKVAATVNCAVYDAGGSTIATCDAGLNVVFKAPTSKIMVSDDNAALTRLSESSGGSGGSGDFAEHIANSTIHVSPIEKSNWNSAVNVVTQKIPGVDAHMVDSTAHITADERAKWNMASSDVEGGLGVINDHISDSSIHLTEENVDAMLHAELYTQGTYRTEAGSDNCNAHAFEIIEPPMGEISQIAVPCRSTSNANNNMYVDNPVYLSIFQKDLDGNWNHAATSTNAITQTTGTTAYYTFDDLTLTGAPIRIIIVADRETNDLTANLIMGARVSPAPEKGLAYQNQALSAAMHYIIDATFTGANVSEKYVPRAHVGDNTHITADERTTWNGTTESFNTHTVDSDIHITAAERNTWNDSPNLYAPKNFGTPNAVLITDANGNITASTIISVSELNTLNNNLTNLKTQLADLESRLAALETA